MAPRICGYLCGILLILSPYTLISAEINSNYGQCVSSINADLEIPESSMLTVTQLSASFAGFGPDMGDEPGYDIYQLIGAQWVDGATNWQFQFTDPLGNVYLYETGNFQNTINLDNVIGLCYGTNYDVQVQAMVGGLWCGFGPVVNIIMETNPSTRVQENHCYTTVGLYTIVEAVYIGNAQEYMWEFTTDNGTTQFEWNSGDQPLVILSQIPSARYNKIYQVRVKAKVCDVWGDYSDICIITTAPLPYTNLVDDECGIPYQGIVEYEWVPGATEYWARVYAVDPNDANFIPQGPVHMFHADDPAAVHVPLYLLDLVSPAVYAVQVKPWVGEQEGDYGPVCLIYHGVAQLGGEDWYQSGTDDGLTDQEANLQVYPNPNSGEGIYFHLSNDPGTMTIEVFSMTGSLVYSETIAGQRGINELTFGDRLPGGIYMVHLFDEYGTTKQGRVIVH